jgi:hypothetical protein
MGHYRQLSIIMERLAKNELARPLGSSYRCMIGVSAFDRTDTADVVPNVAELLMHWAASLSPAAFLRWKERDFFIPAW